MAAITTTTTTTTCQQAAAGRGCRRRRLAGLILVGLAASCLHGTRRLDAIQSWMLSGATGDDTTSTGRNSSATQVEPVATTRTTTTISSKQDHYIPKILHFTYVTPHMTLPQEAFPDHVQSNMDGWKKLHPDWEMMVWDNAMVRHHFPPLVTLMSNITLMAWVADVIRYHALEQFGGMYVDTDEQAVRSLTDDLRSLGAFTVCQKPYLGPTETTTNDIVMERSHCRQVANGIIGATPHHPALVHMAHKTVRLTEISIANHAVSSDYILSMTGPARWTRVVQQHDSVRFLYPFTFLPCPMEHNCSSEQFVNDTRIFGVHQWAKSW